MTTIDRQRDVLLSDPFFRLAARTAEYLMGCQVVADDARIRTKPALLPDQPDREMGELITRELGQDDLPHRYRLITRRDPGRGDRALWLAAVPSGSNTAAPTSAHPPEVGPFRVDDYFRLFQGRHIHESAGLYAVEREGHYTGRLVVKYGRRLLHEVSSLNRRRLAQIREGVTGLTRYYLERSRHLSGAQRFEDIPGITWQVERIADGEVRLRSYDRGGILDFHANTEGMRMPPQVMGTVYADAYSAWVLTFLHQATGDDAIGAAANLAIEFLDRVYDEYAVSMTPMSHADFKNAGLVETLLLCRDDLPGDLRTRLEDRATHLREDLYLPTNVFALRHHWKTAQRAAGFGADDGSTRQELDQIHQRIQRDLMPDGLIQDSNPGRFYFDSYDLTYHQYTLACLADSLRLRDDHAVKETFLRGVEFSLGCLTPDGEVSYMGRGSNNIYHLASAAAAFRFAARRVVSREPRRALTYRRAADLVLGYLSGAQQTDGMLATAVNPEIERMMAWNHCHTPYNALSAYYLLRAAGDHGGTSPPPEHTPSIPMEHEGRFDHHPESGFVFAVTSHYYATFFAGCPRSYSWTAVPHHFTGAPGLAMLGVAGRGAVIPIIDGPTTDYPFAGEDPCGRGTIRTVSTSPGAFLFEREHRRRYVFLDGAILVITRGRKLPWILRAPTRRDGAWNTTVTEGSPPGALPVVTSATDGDGACGVTWRALYCNRPWTPDSHSETISNPRGFADIWQVGRIEADPRSEVVTAALIQPSVRIGENLEVTVEPTDDGVVVTAGGQRIAESPDGLDVRPA